MTANQYEILRMQQEPMTATPTKTGDHEPADGRQATSEAPTTEMHSPEQMISTHPDETPVLKDDPRIMLESYQASHSYAPEDFEYLSQVQESVATHMKRQVSIPELPPRLQQIQGHDLKSIQNHIDAGMKMRDFRSTSNT